jgi:hypothetical protein
MTVMRRFVAAEIVGQNDVPPLLVLLYDFTTTGHGGYRLRAPFLFNFFFEFY